MGNGQSTMVEDNSIFNQSVVHAVMDSQEGCFTRINSVQDITITGDNPGYPTVSANSDICAFCLAQMKKVTDAREKLETDAETRDKHYTAQTADETLTGAVSGGSTIKGLSACTLLCTDQVVADVAQDAVFTANSSCDFKLSDNTKVQDQLSATVNQDFKNQEDVLGQLGSIIGNNSDSISNQISNRFVKNVDETTVNELHSNATELQELLLGDSHSVVVAGIQQSSTSKQLSKLKSVTDYTNTLKSSAQYSVSQALAHKNATTDDILNSVSDTFENASALFGDTVGGVIAIITVLLIAAIILFAIYYSFNPDFRKKVDAAASAEMQDASPQAY
jgi:hypothetical protein